MTCREMGIEIKRAASHITGMSSLALERDLFDEPALPGLTQAEALVTPDESFWIPAFPVDFVADPTGAGDSFAGGFVGCIAAHGGEASSDVLRLAMAYGTAVASFNVEEFGTERVARLTGDEIFERVEELQRITAFEANAVALR